ncbi:MAG: hypothetical protein M1820_004525 [Bogoriella megaspora]|nr:MAG: hypothetical protein M1820_004525 [Bogoriella megaspora]
MFITSLLKVKRQSKRTEYLRRIRRLMASQDDARRRRVMYNERLYQQWSVENDIYCVPIDDREEQRLLDQHNVVQTYLELVGFRQPLGGGFVVPPIQQAPRRILDCGYGQGSWAIGIAEEFPDSEVVGIDIWHSDIDDMPDNLEFDSWNLNDSFRDMQDSEGTYKRGTFDLINSRFLAPGIHERRWPTYIRELVRLLRRGGWLQVVEWAYLFQSMSGNIDRMPYCQRWNDSYRTALQGKRDPRIGSRIKRLMQDEGLVGVDCKTYSVPIGGWYPDARMQQVGLLNRTIFGEALESLAMWPFTQELEGQTKQTVENLAVGVRQEMDNPSNQVYMHLYVAYGQKR